MPAVKQITPQKLERKLAYLLNEILSRGYLNVRGHVSANVKLAGGREASCRCDCDDCRPDTLGGGISVLRDFLEQELQSSDTSIVSCSLKGVLQHLLDVISINKLHIPRWENTLADLLIGA